MTMTWTAGILATLATVTLAASACGDKTATPNTATAPSGASTTLSRASGADPVALTNPGFDFTLSGALTGHVTQADAGPLPAGAPNGTVGGGSGLAGCGPQPPAAQKFGGAYWVATRVDFASNTIVLRLVVPDYTGPGSFPATTTPNAKTPGSAIEINGDDDHLAQPQAGRITISDAKSGTISADFLTHNGRPIHITGRWRCP